jgi:phosphatidylglycerol:prolipoprotein diacylglycerol transferase
MLAIAVLFSWWMLKFFAPLSGVAIKISRDFAFWMVIFGFLGSRLFYVLFHWSLFSRDPVQAFFFWNGGFMFQGGLICALILGYFLLKSYKVSFLMMGDALAPSLALGQALGRVGCFLLGCCYGKYAPEDFPLVLIFPLGSHAPPGVPLYPTQLMEAVGLAILTFGLFRALKGRLTRGLVFGLYLTGAGLLRFWVEFYRGDSRGMLLGNYPSTTWIAGIEAAVGLVVTLTLLMRVRSKQCRDVPERDVSTL